MSASDAAEYEARVSAYLAKNAQQREKLLKRSGASSKSVSSKSPPSDKGKEKPALHEYHLESYGLSDDLVRARFDKYIRDFSLEKGSQASRINK